MPYQSNGMNYPSPGWSPYYNSSPYQPSYPTPQYNPVPQMQPQMPQQPQYTNQAQPPFIPVQIHGHTIKDENTEIAPNDIPMDGTVSLFPTEDYSCIFAKHWNKDGKITTTKFVPVPIDEDYTPTPGFEDEMRARMDELKELIQNRGGKQYRQNNYHAKNNQKQDGGQNA